MASKKSKITEKEEKEGTKKNGGGFGWIVKIVIGIVILIAIVELLNYFDIINIDSILTSFRSLINPDLNESTNCLDIDCSVLGANYMQDESVGVGTTSECCRLRTCQDIECATGFIKSSNGNGNTQLTCCVPESSDIPGGGAVVGGGAVGGDDLPLTPIGGGGGSVGGVPNTCSNVNCGTGYKRIAGAAGGTFSTCCEQDLSKPYSFLFAGGCTTTVKDVTELCDSNRNCSAIGKRTGDGCWVLLQGKTATTEQWNTYKPILQKSKGYKIPYLGGGTCTENTEDARKKCVQTQGCEVTAQQSNGCWHMMGDKNLQDTHEDTLVAPASNNYKKWSYVSENKVQTQCLLTNFNFYCVNSGRKNRGWKHKTVQDYNNYKACVEGGGLPDQTECAGRKVTL